MSLAPLLAGMALSCLPAAEGGAGAAAVLAELNAARARAGAAVVEEHPALADVARWRAEEVAASGSADADRETLDAMGRRLRRGGYEAHAWIQSLLVGGGGRDTLERLRELRPEWHERAATGDFEHAGVGLARHEGRTVVSIVLALSRRTWTARRAAPLADLDRVRETVLATVNAARRDRGLKPVEADPGLDEAAQLHAEDMLRRGYYSHTSPEGAGVGDRIRDAGYRHAGIAAENIAKGLFSPAEVVERWLKSPGHRRNVLRRRVTDTGAGVAFGESDEGFEVIWVQVFAGP